jgi:transposase
MTQLARGLLLCTPGSNLRDRRRTCHQASRHRCPPGAAPALLPPPPRRRFRFPGRKPLDYRRILTGILFVLKTGIAWEDLPGELGYGCGKTCRHYLRAWHQAGIWLRLHAVLLGGAQRRRPDRLGAGAARRLLRQNPPGGRRHRPQPPDRGKSGSKHQVLTDAQGVPLTATVTATNVNEVTQALHVLTDLPPVGGKPGPRRQKPERLQGDRAYDSGPLRQVLRWLGITPMLAGKQAGHGRGMGVFRWFVERTISWLHAFGRLACALICLRLLES